MKSLIFEKEIKLKMAYFLSFLILTFCSAIIPKVEFIQNNSKTKASELLNSLRMRESGRRPASEAQCIDLFYEKRTYSANIVTTDIVFAKSILKDPLKKAEASAYTKSNGTESPIKISSYMQKFRDKYLGFLKMINLREPLAKSFESFLRMRSQITVQALVRNSNYGQYDAVVIGSGVHGVVALLKVLEKNPKLKVLLIDEGDTAGATFRYAKNSFNINSSNRASGEGIRPLPGEGNINELPGFPIQVSDFSAVKYTTANDPGIAAVSALYAAVREYPNVEVLFSTKFEYFEDKPIDGEMTESLVVRNSGFEQNFRIDAQKVLVATGPGESKIPLKIRKVINTDKTLIELKNGQPSRVMTSRDFSILAAESNDPLSFYANKRIAVIGKGDGANTNIEFLIGYDSAAGYGRSSIQTAERPKKIYWIGQDALTCEQYEAKARSRYAGPSTGYRSSSPNQEPLFKAYKEKLDSLVGVGSKKVTITLTSGEKISDLDYVILATGYEPNVRQLFSKITDSLQQPTDVDFFETSFETLWAKTYVSPMETAVGRKLMGREIYLLGTAANLFAKKKSTEAPVGIVENFSGIFVNAPLVVAAVKLATSDLSAKASRSELKKVALNEAETQQRFRIINIQETRYMSDLTKLFLESTFKEALSICQAHSNNKIALNITLSKDGNLEVVSETQAEVSVLMNLLVESRDFFSQIKELLKLVPDQGLLFTANPSGSVYDLSKAQMQIVRRKNQTSGGNVIVMANKAIRLRGLEMKEPSETTEEEARVTEQEARVTEQETRVTEQETRVTEQEARVTEQETRVTEQETRTESIQSIRKQALSVLDLPIEVFKAKVELFSKISDPKLKEFALQQLLSYCVDRLTQGSNSSLGSSSFLIKIKHLVLDLDFDINFKIAGVDPILHRVLKGNLSRSDPYVREIEVFSFISLLEESKKFDFNAVDLNGRTPLMIVLIQNNKKNEIYPRELAQRLLSQKGIDIGKQDKNGQTAISLFGLDKADYYQADYKWRMNRLETFRLLFKALGGDITALDRPGKPFLIELAKLGSDDFFLEFLSLTKNRNQKNSEGNSALMELFLRYNSEDVLRTILEQERQDFDFNIQNNQGETALMIAVKNIFDTRKLNSLLQRDGLDLTLKNNEGLTVFDIVIEKIKTEKKLGNTSGYAKNVLKLLTEYESSGKGISTRAIWQRILNR